MERILCLAIGYVFGLFQTAYIYGKMHGIDIRQHGSGNAGTTNTLRVLGTKAGLIVFAGDVLKCVCAIVACSLLFGKNHPDMIYLLKLYAAAGAILGHNFPFYLGFKGGKGIAATAGLILAFHPTFLPVGVLVFFGIFFTTHYVSLGSLLVYAAFMIQITISGQMGLFQGMSRQHLFEMYGVAAFLTIMAYYKHRENIKRLLKGEERKTYLTKKNKE
ncbi:MAG: glycerol-3-phosphate 1-O-acyltransferase PlsY [Lachnospiraceae bacterium]|nr:glycerol-3-phosphate 1-O-acyltransferase PlsY [Lachnospiraceae bacterium]MCI9341379.1 glycerol-3-phosphate 1-O-acyltransferase PlsY [Lachnospiraceae bacterium]GFH92274.1 glycerol-3-phosphate acyltransferase [Lachnospiraceae bacterium]